MLAHSFFRAQNEVKDDVWSIYKTLISAGAATLARLSLPGIPYGTTILRALDPHSRQYRPHDGRYCVNVSQFVVESFFFFFK